MARKIVTQPDIRAKDGRRRLPEGLHWTDLTGGLHLGYRKSAKRGQWVARVYLGDQRYRQFKVGAADDQATANGVTILNFDQAAKIARDKQVEAATPAGPLTVGEAFAQYVAALLVEKRLSRQSSDVRASFDKHVPQRLFNKPLAQLTQDDVESIRNGMIKGEPDDPEIQRRKKATANRVMASVKAALNRAYKRADNKIASNAAWQNVENFKKVRGTRDVFLDADQQRRLINSCRGKFRDFVVCCLLTGLRPPHEVEALKVRDFDGQRLNLSYGKSGPRSIMLSDEAIAFFEGLAAGREPDEPLLVQDNGQPWRRDDHLLPMREAVARARLPKELTAYALRHSHISSACQGGMRPITIARNVGTSLAMIEKHYAKFLDSDLRQEINAHGPRLGLDNKSSVVKMRRSSN